jgi:hypothetical protein
MPLCLCAFAPLREITGMPMRDGRLGFVSRKGAKAQREENHEPRKTSLQTKRGNPEEISALSPLSCWFVDGAIKCTVTVIATVIAVTVIPCT